MEEARRRRHTLNATELRARQTAHARSHKRRGDRTHTHAMRTYVGKVQTKVGVGNSQRLRARSPQHPTHAKRNRKRLRGVKRRVRGSATALQHPSLPRSSTLERDVAPLARPGTLATRRQASCLRRRRHPLSPPSPPARLLPPSTLPPPPPLPPPGLLPYHRLILMWVLIPPAPLAPLLPSPP